MRLAALVLISATLGLAQGTPRMAVEYSCSAEDLETAGLTCTENHPCAVYLELAGIEAVGGRIVLAGNLHTQDATLASVLLASTDGGQTWTEPFPRVPFSGLEQIQFVDFQNGWVSGGMLQGRPRDAFFLTTRDGGATWTRQPVFEEGRVGTIQQFWFESKDAGAMVVDRIQVSENGSRFELYETQTSGSTWTLKEVSSKPLSIKRAPREAASGWRVRADGPSKSFQVERDLQGRWKSISMFPILVTECKNPPPSLEEKSAADSIVEYKPEPVSEPRSVKPTLKKKRPN